MKHFALPALMIMALLLCGCSKTATLEERFENERISWSEAESISFTAEIVTELNDSSFECTLQCIKNSSGISLEILSPENISGIKAKLNEDETRIEYEGIILALENSSIGEHSPVSAAAMIMKGLFQSPLTQIWTEKAQERELIVAELYLTDRDYARLWFSGENFSLINAELVSDHRAVVKCKISSFTKE